MPRSIRTDIEVNNGSDFISRPILRTNPKLSTNIKIVVEDDNLFLESFDASEQLSDFKYKKKRISKNGQYAYDLSRFWIKNSTPLDLAYGVKREYSDFSILDDFSKQFEETYNYGTSSNFSKLYDSEFKIFAPIWLDKKVPSKFLIFRIKDPLNLNAENYSNNQERINDIMSDSTLVKTIDLSEDSNIGTYIRNHVNSEDFPKSPLTVSFDKDEKTLYNGIDLEKGGFASKGEYQYRDTLDTDKPIIEYNDFITSGFSRNGIACANLLNLEFMFNDEEAEEYSINRYFGLYVDTHDIGEGKVERLINDTVTFSEISHNLDFTTNADYWALPYSEFFRDKAMLGWVKTARGYHNVKNGVDWDISKLEIKIDSNNQDYSDFFGIKKTDKNVESFINDSAEGDFLKLKVVGTPNHNDNFTLVNLKKQSFSIFINKNTPGEIITIEDNLSNSFTAVSGATFEETSSNIVAAWPSVGTFAKYSLLQKYNSKDNVWYIDVFEDVVSMEEDHSFTSLNNTPTFLSIQRNVYPVNTAANTFYADNTILKARTNNKSFSNLGTNKNIANAISEVITENTRFETLIDGETIYVKSPIKGYKLNNFGFFFTDSNAPFLEIEFGEDTTNVLNIGSNFLSTKTAYYLQGGNEKNKSVYINLDDEDQVSIGEYFIDSSGNYNKVIDKVTDSRTINSEYKKIILEHKIKNKLSGVLSIYSEFKLSWGYFSGYDIYDFNFDFFDNSNSDLKELKRDKTSGYPGTVPSPKSAFSEENLENLYLDPEKYYANLIPLLQQETKIDSENEVIENEFDRLKENFTTEFATKSRVVPSINKWALLNSTNVRENPYYLNVSETFGETNFSPSLESLERDRNKMTHEWFYLDKRPDYNMTPLEEFSYLENASDLPIEFDDFKSVDFDYFKSYFLLQGSLANRWSHLPKKRKYTFIEEGTRENFASTIFKGLKFSMKSRKKAENSITKEFIKSTEFNGYRFTALMKTKFDDSKPNHLGVRVIRNKKFKYVVLMLELEMSDSNYDWLNRRLLYELDHKLDSGDYADAQVSGALDLSSISLPVSGFTTVSSIQHASGSTTEFLQQILKDPAAGLYGALKIKIGIIEYGIQVSSVINNTTIQLEGAMYELSTGIVQPTGFYTSSQYETAEYSYEGGGIFAHRNLLEQLSAGNVAEILNKSNDAEYVTVETDGTLVENNFVVNIDDGNEVIKTSSLTTDVDTLKPKAFGLTNSVIGYEIQKAQNEYFTFLKRHNGRYTPDMKAVVTFREPFSRHKIDTDWTTETAPSPASTYDFSNPELNDLTSALYKKLNDLGVFYDLSFIRDSEFRESYGRIKNYFYHKVNEIDTEGVIKLSESDSLLPKYSLIDEIAIDKRDINIFKSRWEHEYYIRAESASNKTLVPGTKNIIEEKSYLSSNTPKIGSSYQIFDFTSEYFSTLDILTDAKILNNVESEVAFTETKSQLIIDFYLEKSAVRFFKNEGIKDTITKYVALEDSFGRIDTLDDDIEEYVSNNILPLFSISSIDLYVLSSKKITSSIESSASIADVENGGYELDNNYSFVLDPRNPLNFRLIYNKKAGLKAKVRPIIKIKS